MEATTRPDPAPEAAKKVNPLTRLLDLTLQKQAIEREASLLRSRVDATARAQFAASGAAPTWKVPGVGQIRLDGCATEPTAYIADPAAFTSYVAERHPDEVVATLTIAAADLPAALEALKFAGVEDVTSEVTTRGSFDTRVLGALTVVDQWEGMPEDAERPEPRYVAVDVDGVQVPGTGGRIAFSPRLVVAPDAKAKSKVQAAADQAFLAAFPDTNEDEPLAEQPVQIGA